MNCFLCNSELKEKFKLYCKVNEQGESIQTAHKWESASTNEMCAAKEYIESVWKECDFPDCPSVLSVKCSNDWKPIDNIILVDFVITKVIEAIIDSCQTLKGE